MSDNHDERALQVLEKAVYRAQESLEKTKHFQPFLMLLNDAGETEIFENEVKDSQESYTLLEETLKERIKEGDVDVMVLLVDTLIPEKFVVRTRDRVFGVGLVVDQRDTLIVLAGGEENDEFLGIYSSHAIFAAMSSSYFESLWKDSTPL